MVKHNSILEHKTYLYLTEFFCGMSVMAVELGASRLLAPYFSSSQIVWTIIIGTIMIAMALGNLYGGKKADQDPDPERLYRCILIAAMWIAAIPVAGKYLIIGISGLLVFSVNTGFLVIAAFVSCMVIFVFPLFLLGTVTPCLCKAVMNDLEENGRIVGRLNAANTIGSIIGTFVPTFISIPAVGTSVTFLIFSGILLLLCLFYFCAEKKSRIRLGIALVLFLLCVIFGCRSSFAFWQKDLTYEGESVYNYLQVYETEKDVVLSTNVLFGVQSVYRKEPGLTGMYYDYAMAGPFMAGLHEKDQLNILVLGMGSGTYATQCLRFMDNVSVRGVEIDEKITSLAREYFSLSPDIPVTTYDGRAYLQTDTEKYDVIFVDAYQDITIPFQMSSKEFFTLVKQHLTEDGVMVVNLNMRGSQEDNINQYLGDTIASVFRGVWQIDVPWYTNRILYAADWMEGESEEERDDTVQGNLQLPVRGGTDEEERDDTFRENLQLSVREGADEKEYDNIFRKRFQLSVRKEQDEELRVLMETICREMTVYESGDRLLTDDKAPVELLGMQVIDELITEETEYYKDIFREQGIQGLLDSL